VILDDSKRKLSVEDDDDAGEFDFAESNKIKKKASMVTMKVSANLIWCLHSKWHGEWQYNGERFTITIIELINILI